MAYTRELKRCSILSFVGCFVLSASHATAEIAPGDPGWPDSYPHWWHDATDPANGLIDATRPILNTDNDAILNQGQLWNMLRQGIIELDTILAPAGGAGFALEDFREPGKPPDYEAPVLTGQLKYASSKFFDRFAEIGFAAGDPGWPGTLILDQGASAGDHAPRYPWLRNTGPQNLAPARTGQAKHLFSWDIEPWTRIDSDNSGRGNGLPDWWEAYYSDQFGVFPKPLTASLTHRESTTRQLYLNNPVSPHADFTVTLSNNLAGEQVVYEYEDSLTGAVSYNWTEIATTGTRLSDISELDNAAQEVVLNNFTFPFYGIRYDRVYISSNGLLTFGSAHTASGNHAIPERYGPNNFIALFWDDLDTNDAIAGDGGDVYYQEFADKIIVQYDRVMRDSDSDRATESNTFQIILHTSGRIDAYYKDMGGDTGSASLGIEDSSGTNGIEVLYNRYRKIHPTFALSSRLALSYVPQAATFAQVSPLTGTTTTGATSTLNVTFHSFDLAPGTYTAEIGIAHSGTGTSPWNIPAVLEVTNPPASISIASPEEGATIWSDQSMRIRVYATDDDFGIDRVEFFHDETKFAEDANPSYYYHWADPIIGTYALTARAVDIYGTVTISDPVTITVLEDADSDRMEDGWERSHFGDLSQDPLGDYDGDGAANLLEYDRGTDPTDANETPVNQPSIIVITEPVATSNHLEGRSITLHADVSDPDSELDRVDFYYRETLAVSDTSVNYGSASRSWYNAPPGTHSLVARAVDIYGTVTTSDAVTITVLADSDRDHIGDAWERRHFGDLESAHGDGDGDNDRDGLSNRNEFQAASNPLNADSDGDGYGDLFEFTHATEINSATDTDSNDIPDGVETYYDMDPAINVDTDADGLPDDYETAFGLTDPAADADNDGLSNLQEYQLGTRPDYFDTDGDLLPDGWEVEYRLDLLTINSIDSDTDGDGLDLFDEYLNGTDPFTADSDGDGTLDGAEVTQGSDPGNHVDGGHPPAPGTTQAVEFTVGDPSGSHSERWEMTITGLGPDTRVMRLSNRTFGTITPNTAYTLRKDSDYKMTLSHLATNQTENGPDYDWQAQIEGQPSTSVLASGVTHSDANRFRVIQNHWILDNEDGLLGRVNQGFYDTNHATGKSARLLKVDLEEVEGTNETGELKIRGKVAVDGVFDRISISRDVAGADVELNGMAYSGGNFEFTLDQGEDILRIDSLGSILSPDNFDLKISLEISGNVVASVDLPVEITTEQTSGSDTYSYWYGDQNSGGSAIFRVFYPMELKETYVKVKYGNLVHKGRTNYLYVSDFESNFTGAGPGWGQSTMNVGHRYVGPSQEYPLGMTVPSSIGAPNTQYFEARTNKWVDEDYMTDLSHGEALMNHTFSGVTGPIAWLPPLDRTAESPDQGP